VDKPKWMDTNLFPFRDYSTDERERMFELYTDAVKRGIITEITAPQLKKLRKQGTYPDQCIVAEEIFLFEQLHESDDHAAQHFVDDAIGAVFDLNYFDFERIYLLHRGEKYCSASEFVGLYAQLFKEALESRTLEIIDLYLFTSLYLSFFHDHLRFLRFVFAETSIGMKPSATLRRLFFEQGKDSVMEPAKMLSYYLKNPRIEDEDAYLVSYIESQVDSSTPVDLESSDTRATNFTNLEEKLKSEQEDKVFLNRELEARNNKVALLREQTRQLRKQNRQKEYPYTKDDLRKIIDATRKKNRSHNYTKIGERLGCHHTTALNIVKRAGLKDY